MRYLSKKCSTDEKMDYFDKYANASWVEHMWDE